MIVLRLPRRRSARVALQVSGLVVCVLLVYATVSEWREYSRITSREPVDWRGLRFTLDSSLAYSTVRGRVTIFRRSADLGQGVLFFSTADTSLQRAFERRKNWCAHHPTRCTMYSDSTDPLTPECVEYLVDQDSIAGERPFGAWCALPGSAIQARYVGPDNEYPEFKPIILRAFRSLFRPRSLPP
jgi:hypothetical protein